MMTSSSLKAWCVLLICGIIWGSDMLAANGQEGSRYCYDCVYQESTGSWAPCLEPIPPNGLASKRVDAPLCPTNCFTKVEPNGDIRRGCYDGTFNIDQTLLGCHVQGKHNSLYCFCEDDLCNARAPPTYIGRTNKTLSSQADTERNTLPSNRPSPPQRQNPPSPSNSRQAFDVVYGVEKTPQVFHAPYQPPDRRTISERRRDYENQVVDNYQHKVDVQTMKENRKVNGHIHKNNNGDRASIHQQDNEQVSREYVDHVQHQRELKTRHEMGRELERIGKLLPTAKVAEPHVEHKRTQHFHKYNVGERTIEHHIVEHYVLHHRIKELLRNRHGLDVHNVDPRQASLIYRLLHPQKAAELDARIADTYITE